MNFSDKELIEQRDQLIADARSILKRCDEENRELSADEATKADELMDRATELDVLIQQKRDNYFRRQRLEELQNKSQEVLQRQVKSSQIVSQRLDSAKFTIGKHSLSVKSGSQLSALASQEYRSGFYATLAGLACSDRERLALTVGDNPQGGYLAPVSLLDGVVKFLDDNVFMRQLATVLPPTTDKSVGVITYDADPSDADWTSEVPATDPTEDTTTRFGRRELVPHLCTKLIKVSEKLLRSSSIDLETWLVQRLGYKFAITEEKAFLLGNGVNQPLGVFTPSSDGIPTSRDKLTGSSTGLTYEGLVEAFYSLKESYMLRSTWLISREFLKHARKLKVSGGNEPIWTDSLAGSALSASNPGLILGRPYRISEYVPSTFSASKYVAIVGDFSHYYIQDSLSFTVRRYNELYMPRNLVGLQAVKETDGQPVLAEAFIRIMTSAS